MTTVNLDSLIPREDFAVEDKASSAPRLDRIDIHHFESSFFSNALRKPDFQRETAHWTPEKVVDLIRTFLEGNLIPAVILWQSGPHIFVIDGAHRMSALIAWVKNDYGDGLTSLEYFGGQVPDEQRKIATRTRELIKNELGSYDQYQAASKNLTAAPEHVQKRVSNLASIALIAQWVPAGDIDAAEDAFFKINQAATPIDPTEKRILKSRRSPNAIAARAVVKGGTGHKYWANFPHEAREKIENLSKQINIMLYDPPIGDQAIRSLDLPVAGSGYNSLSLVIDLINQSNGVTIIESGKKAGKDALPEDIDGSKTIELLNKTLKVVERITSTKPASLGVHPVVYSYTRGGSFQAAAFLATAQFLTNLSDKRRLTAFTNVRKDFEDFLIKYKEFITQIVHKYGSGNRSVFRILQYYELVLQGYLESKSEGDILNGFAHTELSFLSPNEESESAGDGGKKFSHGVKSAAFIRDAMQGVLRCSICQAALHRNSIQIDHKVRRREGGSGQLSNAAPVHPFCNSTVKN